MPRPWPPTCRRVGVAPGSTTSPSSARPAGGWSPASRRSGWPAAPSSCCRCRCGCARSTSSSTRPVAGIASADVSLLLIDHRAGAVHRAGPERSADGGASTRLVGDPAAFRAPKVVADVAGDPAVHQRLDVGPEGRHAPAPHRVRQPRRDGRGRRLRPARSTCWCRGCRCTTTWASSGCSRVPMTTGCDLVLGGPAGLHGRPGPLDAVAVDLSGHGHRRPELRLGARHPVAPPGRARPSTSRALRIALNGAEPVDPGTVEKLRRRRRAPRLPTRARCSRRSAWPRWRSAARSPSPMPRAAHRRGRPPGARDRALRRAERPRRAPAPAGW